MAQKDNKLLDMLTGYAAAHQHPFNIFVHLIGIPLIMFGTLVAFSWLALDVGGFRITLAHLLLVAFFAFYLTLDALFALVFLLFGAVLTYLAVQIGAWPFAQSATIAAVCFFGGYAAQFVGHAVERSMPVLVKHPVQANLAAPFFTVVEVFKLLGLRDQLFNTVQQRIAEQRKEPA